MTRWARGCPTTQKKPHQSTPWSVMVQGLKHTKETKRTGVHSKGQHDKTNWQTRQDGLPSSIRPIKKEKKVCPEFRRNEIASTGLAADLETIEPVKQEESTKDKPTSRKCKKSHKEKKKSRKSPLPETGLSKKLKLLKESIPDLSAGEGKEIEKQIDKEQKREKRRMERADERQSSKVVDH